MINRLYKNDFNVFDFLDLISASAASEQAADNQMNGCQNTGRFVSFVR
jgi:hypothetical protein